jgi:hypothetical protein
VLSPVVSAGKHKLSGRTISADKSRDSVIELYGLRDSPVKPI